METIKRLEEAAKSCLADLKGIESKVSATEGNLAFLDAKKAKLGAEIADLEAKKNAVMDSVGALEKDARANIDDRLNEIKAKEAELLKDRADLKTKIYQTDAATTEADAAKERYTALYAECLEKVKDLEERKVAVMNALK